MKPLAPASAMGATMCAWRGLRALSGGRVYLKMSCGHAVARRGGQRAQVVGSLAGGIPLT